MKYDSDIEKLVADIERGHHPLEAAINRFLESLPGYNNSLHSGLTSKSYVKIMKSDPNNFLSYMKKEGVRNVEDIATDKLEFYKSYVLNRVERRTALRYISSVRQFLRYLRKLGWIAEDLAEDYRLPQVEPKKEIEVIRPEVIEELMKMNHGFNDFVRKRDHLILCLFVRRGLHPKEVPPILLDHIDKYKDLWVLTVCGKRGRWREVMLDPYSSSVLTSYGVERAKYLGKRGSTDNHLILASCPRFNTGSYEMSKAGVSAVIARMAKQLAKQGFLLNLKNVCPNIMRHTAESNDWERSEHLPIHHPELSVTGQYGNSPKTALKHYIRHSRRNAYMLLKGGSIVDELKGGSEDAKTSLQNLQKEFPETGAFPMYDAGI